MSDKILWLDLETTGTDCRKHGIIQIAGILEIDGKQECQFDLPVAPFKGQLISKEAMDVTGKTIDELRRFPPPQEVFSELTGMLEKYINKFKKKDKASIAAYNAGFDMDFLRRFWENNRDNYFGSFFWQQPLDVMQLARWFLREQRHEMENFKLATVANALGIDVDTDSTHDALYDIQLTRAIYQQLYGNKLP